MFRIRKNPNDYKKDIEYDTPPEKMIIEGRLNDKTQPIFFASTDIDTCVHEVRATVYDDLYLATYKVIKPLRLLSLLDYKDNLSFEKRENHISYIAFLFRTDFNYKMCQLLSRRAKELKYDGIEYYSFFSKVIGERKSNIALFGYPLKDKMLKFTSLNKLRIENIKYKLNFGPVE